jgi:hypothetical protein
MTIRWARRDIVRRTPRAIEGKSESSGLSRHLPYIAKLLVVSPSASGGWFGTQAVTKS